MAMATSPLSPLLLALLLSLSIAMLLISLQPKGFSPVKIHGCHFNDSIRVPYNYDQIVAASERIGDGLLPGPEDLAYDAKSGLIYTGCSDGWIRRVKVDDIVPVVEDWAFVGGRPLGIALASDGSLVVANAHKGLLLINANKEVKLLTDEAEGLKFRLTDGVDVASDGMIYFTDASYKYRQQEYELDILEGRPHGRLMSFDPSTNDTVVLLRDLYFANGVALSPDQQSLIFCETPIRRCKRYHVRGEKKGEVGTFIDNLPGLPDNIRYDGEGQYWIGIPMGRTLGLDILQRYPLVRKISAVLRRLASMSGLERGSGVLCVSLDGKPLAFYSDSSLYAVTGGIKIGEHLYHGSLIKPYISRIDFAKLDGYSRQT